MVYEYALYNFSSFKFMTVFWTCNVLFVNISCELVQNVCSAVVVLYSVSSAVQLHLVD
jgi:hypothetical protein